MKQIIPHPLWIGSTGDHRDLRRLYEIGIQAIVQLAYEELPIATPRDLVVCRFPLHDGTENDRELLKLAVSTLTQLLKSKFVTLVCCQAGLSRSPAIAAAALSRLKGEPLSLCLQWTTAQNPCSIHPGMLAQVESLGSVDS